MTSLADVFVEGRIDTKRFGPDIKSGMNSPAVKSGMTTAGKQSGGVFSGAFKNALKIGAAISGAAAVAGGAFLKGAVSEAREAQKVGALTTSTIKATGGAANVSAKQVAALAEAISRKSGIDDEVIQSGQNMLLTFKNIRNEAGKGNDIFNQSSKALIDMSAAMGSEPKQAAIQLGKALNDPVKGISALSRVGVQFTNEQKKSIEQMVKHGDTAKAQKVILKELESQFGGAAAAQATAGEKAAVAWGNFKEDVGTAVLPMLDKLANWFVNEGLPAVRDFGGFLRSDVMPKVRQLAGTFRDEVIPVLVDVAAAVAKTVGWFREHKGVTIALTATIGALVAVTKVHAAVMAVQAAGGLVAMIKGIKIVTTLTKVWAAVQWAMNAALLANPVGLVVIPILALGAAAVIAYKKSETFRKIVDGALRAVGNAGKWMWDKALKPAFGFLVDVFKKTMGFAKDLGRAIGNVFGSIKDAVRDAVLWVVDKMLWMAEKILGVMGKIPGKMGEPFRAAADKVREFREDVNREMDQIKDEEVKVGFAVGRRRSQEGTNSGFGPQGGRSAMGGAGGAIIPRVSADTAGVARVASDVQAKARDIAAELATEWRRNNRTSRGRSGPAGQVLPRGSYSVGMPYLGYPGHYGADYPAATGTPVRAPFAGVVSRALALAYSYGKHIFLNHPGGIQTRYAHLNSLLVNAGQQVRAGQQIGTVGSTGNSTGPHLHYEHLINGRTINPATTGIFDRGGIMRGLGINLSGKPERVLSPRQTAAFERLTAAMDRQGGTGTQHITVVVGGHEFHRVIDDRIDTRIDLTDEMRRARR